MTCALRFSTSLVSALLVTSMALHASAADPPAPAPDAEPRKHALSVTAGLTSYYLGTGMVSTEKGDHETYAYNPLLVGLSGDYMRSFGLVRVGVGLRYTYTQNASNIGWRTFAHELGMVGLVGLGGTTRGGVDLAATLGLGIGHCWVSSFYVYPPTWGFGGELLLSAAIPVAQAADFFLRGGMGMAYYSGNMPTAPEGVWQRPDPYLIRLHVPFELGYRRRF